MPRRDANSRRCVRSKAPTSASASARTSSSISARNSLARFAARFRDASSKSASDRSEQLERKSIGGSKGMAVRSPFLRKSETAFASALITCTRSTK